MTGGVPVKNEIELRFQHDSTSLYINMQRFEQIIIIFLKFANPKYMLSQKFQCRVFYNIYILLELLWKSADKSAGYTSFLEPKLWALNSLQSFTLRILQPFCECLGIGLIYYNIDYIIKLIY